MISLTLQKRKDTNVYTQTKLQLNKLIRSAKADREKLMKKIKFLDGIIAMSDKPPRKSKTR